MKDKLKYLFLLLAIIVSNNLLSQDSLVKIRCKIVNDLDVQILADVSVSYNNKRVKFHYNEKDSVYESDAKFKIDSWITFEVKKQEYATLSAKTEVHKGIYIFKLGKGNTVYIRQGKMLNPIKKHDGIYQIIGYGKEFNEFLDSMGLIKLGEYNGTISEYDLLYIKNPTTTSNKSEKQLSKEFSSNLNKLRHSRLVESAGPIYILTNGTIGHYSGVIKVKFKQKTSSSKIQIALKESDSQLIQINSLDEYIVSAKSKGTYEELINCIETIYNSGDVEYILPLIFVNPSVD